MLQSVFSHFPVIAHHYDILTPEQIAAGDVTGDGIIAMNDVVKLARLAGGFISDLSASSAARTTKPVRKVR